MLLTTFLNSRRTLKCTHWSVELEQIFDLCISNYEILEKVGNTYDENFIRMEKCLSHKVGDECEINL